MAEVSILDWLAALGGHPQSQNAIASSPQVFANGLSGIRLSKWEELAKLRAELPLGEEEQNQELPGLRDDHTMQDINHQWFNQIYAPPQQYGLAPNPADTYPTIDARMDQPNVLDFGGNASSPQRVMQLPPLQVSGRRK